MLTAVLWTEARYLFFAGDYKSVNFKTRKHQKFMLIKINKVGLPQKNFCPLPQKYVFWSSVIAFTFGKLFLLLFDTELIACLPGVYRVWNNAGELLFSKYVPDRYIPYCRKKGFFKEARNCLRMKDHYQLKISNV